MLSQKYRHLFDNTHLHVDLKKRSLKSGAVTVSSQAIIFFIQLGSIMILARILTPEDYGINAMAVAITGFAGIFTHLGLSTATVQREDITHEQVSTLFWINAAIGILLTLIIASLSSVVGWFYKTSEMIWVMLALSATFTITGLSVQHSALLTRQMRFYSIAKIQVVAMLAGILVAIISGLYGFGYWALVFNTLTQVLATTAGLWLSCRWIPGLPSRHPGVLPMIKFGADLVGFNVINYFARNLDNVLIGRFHGSGPLGLYSKAYQLLMMPITKLRDPVTRVAMPALSTLQNEPQNYRNYYIKLVSILAFVSMPLVAFLFACSDQIIKVLLGSQWLGASSIFKALAIAAFIQPTSTTWGLVLLSTGQSRRYLKWGVVNSFVIIVFFIIGLQWGAYGVAVFYTIATYLLLYPTLKYCFKNTPLNPLNYFYAIWKQFIGSVVMGFCCYSLVKAMKEINDILTLIICLIIGTIVYLTFFVLVAWSSNDLKEYYSYGRQIFSKS